LCLSTRVCSIAHQSLLSLSNANAERQRSHVGGGSCRSLAPHAITQSNRSGGPANSGSDGPIGRFLDGGVLIQATSCNRPLRGAGLETRYKTTRFLCLVRRLFHAGPVRLHLMLWPDHAGAWQPSNLPARRASEVRRHQACRTSAGYRGAGQPSER
jgi:hypothetical protein